ncbi:hypothetical protein Q7C36_005147 [Tachysurus vachellii]|uniref:PARP catalytic domain-containing protein n=1 Tax=Tachysurus vachellii TaxID=175792 RepID=A0AA88NLM4_TACVA|nr:hypothetical protein Q7C36_005147 [Tachysurus vachellii]
MLESDEKMDGEVEDDFHLGYSGELEEYHNELEEGLQKPEDELMADCRCYRPGYPSHRFFIMYHGTTWANALKIQAGGFIPSLNGMLGPGVYLSRSFQKASKYPRNGRQQKLAVLKVNVRVGKVKRIDYQGHPLQTTWHQHGYDTAWVPPNCGMVASGLEEDCVYDPNRIQVLQIIPQ